MGEARREIYVIVCQDGNPHPGRQDITLGEARKRIVGLGVPFTSIDALSTICGPHRIQKFVSDGEAFDPRTQGG